MVCIEEAFIHPEVARNDVVGGKRLCDPLVDILMDACVDRKATVGKAPIAAYNSNIWIGLSILSKKGCLGTVIVEHCC